MEMNYSSLGSMIVECESNYDETALRRLDRTVQGPQFRKLERLEVFVCDTEGDSVRRIGKMLARSRAKGILVLK